jgi:hypothetical protein
MARSQAAQLARSELEAAEKADRALNDDINEAIARTDAEVFSEAMGDEPIGEDADTELEEMGDGLEGDELEEEGEEPAEEEPAVETAEPGERPPQPPPEPREQQPSIPPRVLRETRERFREQESVLNRQISDLLEQNRQLMQQLRTPPQPQPQPPPQPQRQPEQAPDMWADPEGYRQWLVRDAEQKADARVNAGLAAFRQEQQQDHLQRLNVNLENAANGIRGYEFRTAYRDLLDLPKTHENATLVRRLVATPDPGQAILDWWESSSNPDYVEYHRDQVRQTYGVEPGRRVNGGRQQRPVRHEVRLPRSLSEASGGRSQHTIDPEMFDSSEQSVFDYGSRR